GAVSRCAGRVRRRRSESPLSRTAAEAPGGGRGGRPSPVPRSSGRPRGTSPDAEAARCPRPAALRRSADRARPAWPAPASGAEPPARPSGNRLRTRPRGGASAPSRADLGAAASRPAPRRRQRRDQRPAATPSRPRGPASDRVPGAAAPPTCRARRDAWTTTGDGAPPRAATAPGPPRRGSRTWGEPERLPAPRQDARPRRHRASPVAGRWRAPPPGHRGGRQARRPGRPARGGPPGRRSVLAEGLPDVLHGVGRLVLRGLDRVGGVGAEAVAAALPLQVLVAGGAAQALLGLPLRPV